MNILSQWKVYFQLLHYNIFVKKKIRELNTKGKLLTARYSLKNKKLNKELEKYEKQQREHIANLWHFKNPNLDKEIHLYGHCIKETPIQRLWNKLFKIDGYLLYGNKAKDFKIVKLRNMRYFKEMKGREFYNLHKKIGTYRNKPLFICIYPIPITLETKGDKLFYDAESFYNYVNIATKGNLTRIGEQVTIMDFLKKNFVLVIFVLIVIILLVTPEGQQILNDLLKNTQPQPRP
jgi:hypothetical protein